MINYYRRDQIDADNCETFDRITRDFPDIRFFQPSEHKAPWHVQAIIDMGEGEEPAVLNFWPHKLKGQRQPLTAVEGELVLRGIIEDAIEDAAEEPFDVIEG